MSIFRRREIYVGITLISGILTISDFFLDINILNTIATTLTDWVVLLAYFAIVLGVINIYIFHGQRISRQQSQWIYSAWLLLVMSVVVVIGVVSGVENPIYSFLFTNVYGALGPSGYAPWGDL